jgi:serine phosphatase RsbU (regulator of sigma subunit)/CHASE2 domain-containing sensor protein
VTGARPETPAPRIAKVRLFGAALLVAFAIAVALDLPSALPLQTAGFDTYQRVTPRGVESTPVTIVAIDDRSLASLGRWPWPRTLLAQLVHTINAYAPGAIGVDIVMPDPDPLSPERALAHVDVDLALLERIAELPSNDMELATAFRAAPSVVVMADAADATTEPLRVVPIAVRDTHGDADAALRAQAALKQYPAALSTLATLNEAAHGWGFIAAEDSRGIVRQVPLVANVNGTLAPSLGLEMWRVASHATSLRLTTTDGAAQSVSVGARSFPTQRDGSVRPYFSPHEPDRFVSAVDVLSGSAGKDRLGRTFVLIGVTATMLRDYVWTPVGEPIAGVEVHAQLLENMDANAFLLRPRWASFVEALAVLLTGALLIVLAPRLSVRSSALVAAACIVALLVSAWLAFRTGRWLFDAATPSVGLVLLFGTLLAMTLADSTRNRKALERVLQFEREEAARVAGELQAARRIQLDTLPRPEAIDDARVELAATMEPAQEVGGDLYDFYRLGHDRLFLMLGDVSGKGLSASIFMAVSKALCKSTMLRADSIDLGALLSQANHEVERDNPASFFVTLFVGVLDLRDGELEYCNAGHENPWLVRVADASATRLTDGGGPPLCVVDEFEYRSARTRLAAGDVLCIVSDGVTEANDAAGALYGAARAERVLARADSARAAVDELRADVKAFAAGAEQSDDMTVLAVRWRGGSAAWGNRL